MPDHGTELLTIYDRVLPQVYGYLLPREAAFPSPRT